MTFCLGCVCACGTGTEKTAEEKSQAAEKKDTSEPPRPESGAVAHIPVGKFHVGSRPGELGRQPAAEAMAREVELGPFRIDVYPFPGDPTQPPRVGVSESEAVVLCAQKSGRLCTELEWERACRGPDSSVYPTGATPCDKGASSLCLSGFDVALMGSLPEWTSSSFGKQSTHAGKPVMRGALESAPSGERRCAGRAPKSKDVEVGFRCCYGAPNAASYEEPTLGEPYREVEITKQELSELLKKDDRTKHLAQDVETFKPEAARTVLARGPGDTMGFTLTTNGLHWQPDRGSKFLIVTGRSGKKTSFVLAYYLAGNEKSLAGSFVMENEPGPIALAYASSIRPRVHFSGCFGCTGETGKVLFRPPEELVLLQP